MSLMENVFRASKALKKEIDTMEGYLIFLDKISEIDMELMRSRKQEELQFIEDCEKNIKESFEEFMKNIVAQKARVEKL